MRLFALSLFSFLISLSVTAQSSKIDPSLLGNTNHQNQLDYIVLLNSQADLTAVSAVKGKNRKGSMAYSLLKKNSDDAQLALVNWLRQRHIEYTPWSMASTYAVIMPPFLPWQIAKRFKKYYPIFRLNWTELSLNPFPAAETWYPNGASSK
ncbi:MAG: hypothetical protein IPO65_02900 [Saprospiraceae bacterium]|nr:hypothetical protein [Saprospiraceae bacterium]